LFRVKYNNLDNLFLQPKFGLYLVIGKTRTFEKTFS